VELLFPINQSDLEEQANQIYDTMWNDNLKTRVLTPDDTYRRVDRRGLTALDAQAYFAEAASAKVARDQHLEAAAKPTEFQPMLSPENQPNPLNYDDGSDPD
jgi:polyphosphate kinase